MKAEGNMVDINFYPNIVNLRGGGVLQRSVEVKVTLDMTNEEFDKLNAALRNPTAFKVAIFRRDEPDDPPPEP